MNQKNFEYLRDQVKFTGFGEGLENELKERMQKQLPEFHLSHQARFGGDLAAASLHFKKSDQSDMYFFNRYDLAIKKEAEPDMLKQSFYINKGNNITLKEAFNLLSGRAVNKDLSNKEGQLYNAWLQLDFKQTDKNGNYQVKQYHQNYGFDLEKQLAKLTIKELSNEQDKGRLIESLQKGNRQAVTLQQDGHEQKVFIDASPKFKSVNVYDGNMQRLQNPAQGLKTTSQTVKQEERREGQKQTSDDPDDLSAPKQKRGRKKSQSIN